MREELLVQSLASPEQHAHLLGDVPALFLIATVLAWLTPRPDRTA
jgi:hypothetical protein